MPDVTTQQKLNTEEHFSRLPARCLLASDRDDATSAVLPALWVPVRPATAASEEGLLRQGFVGGDLIVALCFLATLAVHIGGSDDSAGSFTSAPKEGPIDPYGLAVALEPTDDPTLNDPTTYRRLTEAEFDKAMHPSSDLEGYPYPFIGERVILYGEVDEVGSNFAHARGGTYFEATLSYHDLGPLVSWSLNSEDVPIIGIKADLGNLVHNDEVEIFAEVRRPFLTGEEVFGTPLRKPLLIAHIVRVIR